MTKDTFTKFTQNTISILKKNSLYIFFIISILFYESVYRVHMNIKLFDNFQYTLLSGLTVVSICYLICSVNNEKLNKTLSITFISLSSLIFSFYYVYYSIFKTTFSLYSLTGAKDVLEFKQIIFSSIYKNLFGIILLFLPLIILIIINSKINFSKKSNKIRLSTIGIFVFSFALFLLLIHSTSSKPFSQYALYYKTSSPDLSVSRLGLSTTIRLDLERLIFGINSDFDNTLADNDIDDTYFEDNTQNENSYVINIENDKNIDEQNNNNAQNNEIVRPNLSNQNQNNEADEDDDDENNKPKHNVMNIDFSSYQETENNSDILELHKYFSNIEPSKTNEYTGIFKGDNLIFFVAEAFFPYAVIPELMPTIHNMMNSSFVFENFYTPLFGVSTSDGEYTSCTSLLPKQGVWSFARSGDNLLPFTFGNQFANLGYKTMAYHNHSYKYYDRHLSHPNMGYEYKGVGNGLDIKVTWPESDLEMIEVSTKEYIDDAPFHTYYLTVSGHLEYNNSNYIANKNRSYVEDLPYSDKSKAYIACNLELEFALKKLIEELEENGELQNTVIALTPDHYPYGLPKSSINELVGHEVENNFELFESVFILWKEGMETIKVEKPCDPIDINPTISNLFGLEYDSRLLMGSDILSDQPGLVIFNNRSWITKKGRYNSIIDSFTPSNESAEITTDYINSIHKIVSNKFKYSAKVLETDYYSSIFTKDEDKIILK